jgi:phosphatidylserine/phosphatidylglycerophosphate/cardiolipin synthase-like enzyme
MGGIEVTLLRDTEHGGDRGQPAQIAAMMADFVKGAAASLDVAIYDFRLGEPLAKTVLDGFKDAAGRGVAVRIAFDAGKPAAQTMVAFEAHGADPAPVGTKDWLEANLGNVAGVELKAITAPKGNLMHNKYIIRDRGSEEAAVWMGSANFTDAAWTVQENNILRLTSPQLAQEAYETDFGELWERGDITTTGTNDLGDTTIAGASVGWKFSPGEGKEIDEGLVDAIKGATTRLRVASMVLTSHGVLEALAQAIDNGTDLKGIYDGGQMEAIEKYWGEHNSAILPTWEKVKPHLVKKPTPEYSEDGPHNFMHDKILVADEQVLTGSHNFSQNAEKNAENQVQITDTALADQYAAYVDDLVATYQAG